MIRKVTLCFALLALVGMSAQAQLFVDDFNDVSGDTEWWAVGWDTGPYFSANGGQLDVTGGVLDMPASGFAQVICKDHHGQDIEIVADITIGGVTAGGFFTLGMLGADQGGGGSQVDCDLYESGGNFFIGVYNAGSYVNSATITPAPVPGSAYVMAATRVGDVFSIELLDAGATVASVTASLPGLYDYGYMVLKCLDLDVSVDEVTLTDLASATVDFTDDFASADATKWALEPNPDVNEGGSGGMRIYNSRSDGVENDLPRFESSDPGFLTMGPNYCRMPTRYWPAQGYDWYGNVDVMVKLQVNQDSYFSVAVDNRANETNPQGRYGVVLDAANDILMVGNDLALAGFPASEPSFSPIASQSLSGLWDYTTNPDVYLYLQRNGNQLTTWLGLAGGGDEIAGTMISNADITGAYASGQIVLTNHWSDATPMLVDQVEVYDFGTAGWGSSVDEWNQY